MIKLSLTPKQKELAQQHQAALETIERLRRYYTARYYYEWGEINLEPLGFVKEWSDDGQVAFKRADNNQKIFVMISEQYQRTSISGRNKSENTWHHKPSIYIDFIDFSKFIETLNKELNNEQN